MPETNNSIPVIILCGGMGTRLREETEYKPKPMVEIGGKPILWHIMKHYAYYGFKDFILALGYKGYIIKDYFLNFYNYSSDFTIDLTNNGAVKIHNPCLKEDWKVTLVETGEESMTGYRTKICGKYLNKDRFMMTYGDAVSNVNIRELIAFNNKMNTKGTVTGVYPPSRFGDLVTNKNIVIRFKQQLKETDNKEPINGGYFVFKREFLDLIPDDPKADIEGIPMNKLVEINQLSVYRHNGFWQCMDTYRDNQLLEKMWKENPVWKIWE
jgi:glucose-1-phosphate cytidylyltransferase